MPAPLPAILETIIDLGDRTAPVTARVNRRARRLIVKVDSVSGRVLVTAPSKRALPEALKFAAARSHWIRDRLDEGARAQPFRHGFEFPFKDERLIIASKGGARSGIRCEAGTLTVGGAPEHLNRRVTDWLKREARAALSERSDHYSNLVGRTRRSITIRDTKSRWGSCAPDGALSFSWRLVLAPSFILDYVAAHECAHLVHLNHSPAFWRLLKTLGVDSLAAREWFSVHGPDLYSYGVEPG